ncbi:hypothetical protein F4814DRAFT_458298 [Daldinia grandis]|nr:hypothetical protein F4814DRAFT_458298 [Daldinia grandis]
MASFKRNLDKKVNDWLDGLNYRGLTNKVKMWKEDDDIGLLTTLPGFSFDRSEMPTGLKLAAMREVILSGAEEASLSTVLNGVKRIFERSYDVRKEYTEDNRFIWPSIWRKNKFWSDKTTCATPDTLKKTIDFYVAGFKNGHDQSGGGGITLPIDAFQNPLMGSVLISIAKWLRLVEGTKYCFTIKLEEFPGRDQSDDKPSRKRKSPPLDEEQQHDQIQLPPKKLRCRRPSPLQWGGYDLANLQNIK